MATVEIVGREQELESLRDFVAVSRGGPSAAVLVGEAGIGKSTLWEEAVLDARACSMPVLRCRPTHLERGLPFAALGDLFETVDSETVDRLPAPQRRALRAALLLETPRGPPVEQRAVGVAVRGVFRLLAASSPVLVAIDDAQWLDRSSLAVLQFAWRRLVAEPVALLIAVRGEDEERALDLAAVAAAGRLRQIAVGPLTAGALQRLLRTRVGVTLARPTLLRLLDVCGGNPFYALEIGRVLAAAEPLAPAAPLPVPPTLAGVMTARVAALPKPVQALLLPVAAMADPTLPLLEALRGNSSLTRRHLRRAATAGVLEIDDERVRFSHPLLAAALYGHADPLVLRRLHQRLAAVVPDIEQRARHLALAAVGTDAAAAAALDAAAAHAAARGGLLTAADLSELAVQFSPRDAVGDLVRRRLITADYHLASGAPHSARAALEPLVGALPPGWARADVLERLARTSVTLDAYVDLCERALQDAVGDDRRLSRIYSLLAAGWPGRGGSHHALVNARRALEHAERGGDRRGTVVARARLGLFEIWAGRAPNRILAPAIPLESSRDALGFYESARMTLALLSLYQGRLEEARAMLEQALRKAGERGDEASCVEIRGRLVELEIRSGDWALAAAHADAARELSEQIGLEHVGRAALFRVALVEAHRGRIVEARAAAVEGAELADDAHLDTHRLMNRGVLGFVELSLGNSVEAGAYLIPTIDWLLRLRLALAPFPVGPYALEALIGTGDVDRAGPLVNQLAREGRRLKSPWTLAIAARLRGSLHAADGNVTAAMTSLIDALAQQESRGWPFEHARTLLALGEVQRRAKQKRAARQSLDRAHAAFEDLHAAVWAERARVARGRVSGRAPDSGDLTPTERRVADLVATGRSNREVAAALVVATRTVEWNLTKIYSKLGVRSRSELIRRLVDEAPPRQAQ